MSIETLKTLLRSRATSLGGDLGQMAAPDGKLHSATIVHTVTAAEDTAGTLTITAPRSIRTAVVGVFPAVFSSAGVWGLQDQVFAPTGRTVVITDGSVRKLVAGDIIHLHITGY